LYKAAAKKDKQHFFDNKIKVANTLHRYMDLDSDILTFMINANIVNTIIGDMFFQDDEVVVDSDDADDDVVGAAARKAAKKLKEKTNAMKLFILNEVDEDEDDPHSYTVTINNIMRFNLAMDHVGSGMLFWQTVSAIQHAKEHTKTAKMAGITDLMVGQYVHIMVGSTL
jgi:microcompartment protein CcmK/EutM